MDAGFILRSIQLKYPKAAIVPELRVNDASYNWLEPSARVDPDSSVKQFRSIDALMMQTLERTAIEIKVSRADFNRDTHAKRSPWRRLAHRFIYAVPHDLNVVAPHGCGLWKVHPDGSVKVAKKAIINRTPEALPQDVIQRLMYRASNAARKAA